MERNKKLALEMLNEKQEREEKITYVEIMRKTGYSKIQLKRLNAEIKKRDIESILLHGNTGRKPSTTATDLEISYIIEFKKKHLEVTISQFMDIYHEDVIWNEEKIEEVLNYNLKIRSYSFYENLYHKNNWIIPRTHKSFNKDSIIHALREPSLRRGILIIIDGTPHDWFCNGLKQSLHLAIDDATGEFLAGWFMGTETLEGYCHLLYQIITKYGIPISFYSDKHTILKSTIDGNLSTFGRICNELGIELIFANTPQAKGKVEKANDTIQQRLLNDIKRYKVTSVERLNEWFNSFYCHYLNKKFSYEPKEERSEFIPLKEEFIKHKLNDIFCIKEERTILNGNCIVYQHKYYIPIDNENNIVPFYKGMKIEIRENIFTKEIKIYKDKKIYNTKVIEMHETKLKQILVNNQKELNNALNSVYSNSEEKRKVIQAIIEKNAIEEKNIRAKIEARNILRGASKSHKKKWN